MKSIVQWAIRNTPAMNTLMVGILAVGAVSLYFMRREFFPEFDLEYITITVPYPGASPDEVEEGICQKIEEAVQSLDGIKEITSTAGESAGMVILELDSNVRDVQRVLNEVRSEIDRIPSFPDLAEDPEVEQITIRTPAIRVGVVGPDDDSPEAELALRDVAERVRDELLRLPAVSQVKLIGVKDYQIDIEIPEDTLRKYGLTLQEVAKIVRRENIELPGGSMKTDSQEVLLRGKNKHMVGSEIAKIPLVTRPGGVVLTVGDLGAVRDEFADTTAITRINGKPGVVISVDKTAGEDILAITDAVNRFVTSVNEPGGYQLPPGYGLETWRDMSMVVRDRLELLSRNGLQGLVLVFIMLTLFLELRLAFWVALGIPISILGTCGVMLGVDLTLNMISMFAFLMALGILVDDAIVVGENVFTHRQAGKSPVQAAIDGTCEVLPSVTASVTTTIIAFTPLLLVPGVMGKFIAVIPVAIIVMLLFSLVECTLILPCHLAHTNGHEASDRRGRLGRLYRYSQRPRVLTVWTIVTLAIWGVTTAVLATKSVSVPTPLAVAVSAVLLGLVLVPHVLYVLGRLGAVIRWLNTHTTRLLETFSGRAYTPALRWSLGHPAIVLSTAVTTLLLAYGAYKADIVPFSFFPKLDHHILSATIVYPDGTPSATTERATLRMEEAIRRVDAKYGEPDKPLLVLTHRTVGYSAGTAEKVSIGSALGSNVGSVGVEIVEAADRNVESDEVVNAWREMAGDFPGAESVRFKTAQAGPGGTPIEFVLTAKPEHMAELEEAVERCKAELGKHAAVFDIADDSRPGKWEFQLKIKDEAKAMGNSVADLAETVRASYYGQEVMRLQRGRHEVKLMVRYPREERRLLANFDEIRIRTQPSVAAMIQEAVGKNPSSSQTSAAKVAERPLTELADVDVRRGYSRISRVDQLRSITITADVDEKKGKGLTRKIVKAMKKDFGPLLLKEYPNVQVRWKGQQERTAESVLGLVQGLAVALVAMFALLTLEFKSYAQPLLILAIIPFGAIGAVIGHAVMGLEVTMFSLFGLVALSGVVVNDSIVLIDFINRRVRSGIPLREALLDSGRRRFRPVLLTSLTTIAGLMPLLIERSLQAQVMIPMAVSLCFGLAFATILVLILVPTFYSIYARLTMPAPDLDGATSALPPPSEPTGLPHPAPTGLIPVER